MCSDIYTLLEKICLEGTRVQAKLAVSAIAALSDTSEQLVFSQLCKVLQPNDEHLILLLFCELCSYFVFVTMVYVWVKWLDYNANAFIGLDFELWYLLLCNWAVIFWSLQLYCIHPCCFSTNLFIVMLQSCWVLNTINSCGKLL